MKTLVFTLLISISVIAFSFLEAKGGTLMTDGIVVHLTAGRFTSELMYFMDTLKP